MVVWQELGVANSFTLEASFWGSDEGAVPWHYHVGHLTKTGRRLCKTVLMCSKDENMLHALQQIRFDWTQTQQNKNSPQLDNSTAGADGGGEKKCRIACRI